MNWNELEEIKQFSFEETNIQYVLLQDSFNDFFANRNIFFILSCRLEYVVHVPASSSYTIFTQEDFKDDIPFDESASELTFVTSPWSTKCLVYNDYLYNCHSSHGNKVYWRCHNYSRYLFPLISSKCFSHIENISERKRKNDAELAV